MDAIERLEEQLDSFEYPRRQESLDKLCKKVDAGEIEFPPFDQKTNVHCHTFYSYNAYGYSPSKFAWLARREGLAVAGIIDFDVLDGVEEFCAACEKVGLKGCAGLETRVFVPEFSDKVMNSPGEPGIAYHMGVGFPRGNVMDEQREFLGRLRRTAEKRNRGLMERVNEYLKPAKLDYARDVLTLTPSGNATERHICLAYVRKAKEIFGQGRELENFWSEKLKVDAGELDLPEGRKLQNTLRAKTMKKGGVGYVEPDPKSFPLMADVNSFVLASQAIPASTWLNGLTDGEKEIERLFDVAMSTGMRVLNIIPDRNFTEGVEDEKLENLYDVVRQAQKRDLPIIAGTEMNSPSNRFVDNYESQALSPLTGVFLRGAYIVYAHSVLQRKCGLGYTSKWANRNFDSRAEKNEFFEQVGEQLDPKKQDAVSALDERATGKDVLAAIES